MMTDVEAMVGDTPPSEQQPAGPDHGSATAAMIVGSVFIAIVGAAVLVGSLYRRHPILMAIVTLAAIVAGVLVIT